LTPLRRPVVSLLPLLGVLAACSAAGRYEVPATPTAAHYKEAQGWALATPLDQAPRGPWWEEFGDPILDDLERRAEAASPTVAVALARYQQARALAQRAGAERLPTIAAGASASREHLSGDRPLASGTGTSFTDVTAGASLDWEIDLWGRLGEAARAGRLEAAASNADLASARLSLHAMIADAYFRLRGADAQIELLRHTVEAYARAFDLTNARHQGGIASGLDTNRARHQLAQAKAEISRAALDRDTAEHELAALIGEIPSGFSIPPATPKLVPFSVGAGAPAQLLQRRPDIAAAERRVAAANARIGVARAAWFPTLTLGLSGGFEAAGGNIASASSGFWALGPLSALATIFDGGRRAADVRRARAGFDEAAASYRETVLSAFRQVEDELSAERHLAAAEADEADAAAASARTAELALTRYRDGASDYLEVVTAQTAALDAQRAALNLHTQRLQANVALIRALGGGFDTNSMRLASEASPPNTAP
jgi:multidrug efflux system outer membrane protein